MSAMILMLRRARIHIPGNGKSSASAFLKTSGSDLSGFIEAYCIGAYQAWKVPKNALKDAIAT